MLGLCAGLFADGPGSASRGRTRHGERNATEHRADAAQEEARRTGKTVMTGETEIRCSIYDAAHLIIVIGHGGDSWRIDRVLKLTSILHR